MSTDHRVKTFAVLDKHPGGALEKDIIEEIGQEAAKRSPGSGPQLAIEIRAELESLLKKGLIQRGTDGKYRRKPGGADFTPPSVS